MPDQQQRRAGPRRGGRALARYRVVQALYAWRQGGTAPWAKEVLPGSADEPAGDGQYAALLLQKLGSNMEALQQRMEQVLDRPVGSLDPVEYSIIMLGLCELLYLPDVPAAVVIDEAVEIAQLLAGANGDKYVNAALDDAARQIRPQ